MFDDPNAGAARMWEGTAWRLKARSNHLANEAAEWEENAQQWMSHAKTLESQVANLKAQLAAAQLALAVEKAHAGGLLAQKDAYAAIHPQSPLLVDTGKRFKVSGNIKTQGRLIYEANFDRILREAGIADPIKYRAD
jgi:predicted secreted Zn-dependent protease